MHKTPSEAAKHELNQVQSTGFTDCDLSIRYNGIHLLGVMHRSPMAIARLTGAITRFEPDVVAVEAKPIVISSYHPDNYDPRWPPEHEVEAAAYAADHIDDLLITGIDSEDWEADMETLGKIDSEVFAEFGLIDSPEDLSISTYYDLDPQLIRKWREETRQRQPEAYDKVLGTRDDIMAGHLFALSEANSVDTIVAAIGVQHLTGVLDRIQDPSRIPSNRIELPKVYRYPNSVK